VACALSIGFLSYLKWRVSRRLHRSPAFGGVGVGRGVSVDGHSLWLLSDGRLLQDRHVVLQAYGYWYVERLDAWLHGCAHVEYLKQPQPRLIPCIVHRQTTSSCYGFACRLPGCLLSREVRQRLAHRLNGTVVVRNSLNVCASVYGELPSPGQIKSKATPPIQHQPI
jgi:hypothetical protein